MAPVTANPVSRTPLAADVSMGEVAARRDHAVDTIRQRDNDLARIDAALTDPAHAGQRTALLELKGRYTKERQAAVKVRDQADKTLQTSFGQLRGGGSAKEAAGKEYSKLEAVDAELAEAHKAKEELVHTFKAATDAVEVAYKKYGIASPQGRAALAKATGAEAALAKADRDVNALEHARSALVAELDGTEHQALAEAKQAGSPAAATLDSFSQLAAVSSQRQVEVVGAPIVAQTQADAVNAAMTALTKAGAGKHSAEDAAAAEAKTLTAQLRGATTGAQDDMVRAAAQRKDLLPEMARLADSSATAAGPVIDTLTAATSFARTHLAEALAKGTTSMQSALIKTLDARMQNGEGFEAAEALARGLEAAGKPELANQVTALARARMGALTTDFEAKSKEVAQAKTDLARLISGFGPMVPPEKQQAAVDAFKARHKEAFDAWEASGTKLARAASYIAEAPGLNEKAAELLPDALSTQGGQALVTQALSDSSKGLRSFLDGAKDSTKVGKYLQQVAVKGATQQALNLLRQGNSAGARAALAVLKQNELLGVDPKKADKLVTALEGVVAGDPESLKAFDTELRAAKPSVGMGTALKAFAWAASIASGIQRGANATDFKSAVKASAEVVGPTGEIAATTVEMLVKSEAAWAANTKLLGKGLGAMGTGLSAALDAISSVQSFAKGETVEGSLAAATALGGAALAVDSFGAALGMQVVPVWGQIAGAALVIGGTIGKVAWENHKAGQREEAAEADAKVYLEAAGLNPVLSEAFSDIKRADGRNVGMMIQQVAHELGVTPKELFDRLAKLPQQKLRDFVNTMKDVELDDLGRMKEHITSPFDQPRHLQVGNMSMAPLSRGTAVAWTRQFLKDNGV